MLLKKPAALASRSRRIKVRADIVCGGGSCLNGGMMPQRLSISHGESLLRVQAASARWIAGALALTAAAWLAALAGLLAIADRVHDDVPALLAVKLPLLASHPELIFAGESRTVYQVDPDLAAQLIGKPPGAAVNIAYDAGEPLALVAAMRREPDRVSKRPCRRQRRAVPVQ